MMGGKINVKSQFGKGSIFMVNIPQKISKVTKPINDVQEEKQDKPYNIKINLLPDISKEELEQFLKKNGQEALLNAYLHPRLAKSILKSQVPDHQIIDWLKGVTYTFDKPYGFDNSQVSIGGIEFSDIDENLGSKIERGIHFLGELLDYDAPCGGYNLMWAVGTGLFLAKKL